MQTKGFQNAYCPQSVRTDVFVRPPRRESRLGKQRHCCRASLVVRTWHSLVPQFGAPDEGGPVPRILLTPQRSRKSTRSWKDPCILVGFTRGILVLTTLDNNNAHQRSSGDGNHRHDWSLWPHYRTHRAPICPQNMKSTIFTTLQRPSLFMTQRTISYHSHGFFTICLFILYDPCIVLVYQSWRVLGYDNDPVTSNVLAVGTWTVRLTHPMDLEH